MTISLKDTFGHALDKFWNFQIGGFCSPYWLVRSRVHLGCRLQVVRDDQIGDGHGLGRAE